MRIDLASIDREHFNVNEHVMNGELVYLFALANALDYYGKPNAKTIMGQAETMLGQLVAGTHGSRKYVPGTRPLPPAIMPIYAPWPGEY